MILWRGKAVRAHGVPVVNAIHALGDAAPLRLETHPRHVRYAVNVKWLAALVLMAIAAIVLLGAVWTSLGCGSLDAMAPVLSHRLAEGDESPRADRLALPPRPREPGVIRSDIEQLADDVEGTKAFTYVRVLLADVAGHDAQPVAGDKRPPVVAAAPAPQRANVAGAIAANTSLPPEIRFGTSRPKLPANASAYADEDASQLTALPGVPINLSVVAKSAGASVAASGRHVIAARAGDTLENMLTAIGVTAEDAGAIAALLTPHSWFSRNNFVGGEIVTVVGDGAQGRVRPLEVTLAQDGRAERIAALSDTGAYVAAAPHAAVEKVAPGPNDDVALRPAFDVGPSGMKLDESLGRLAQDNRVAPALIDRIMRLCAQTVDLETAISADDTAELLYNVNPEGQRELAFAALTLDGHTYRYYRFTAPDDGSTDYYDANGRSVTASLMKQPVAGRLGDGFGWRIHPILKDRRFHEGVDYAAPFGSPIAAGGDGILERIGEEPGYGKYVRIRHDFGYETTYAHISGMPHGLRVGQRIHRGQTIAYIGSTGLSTGPHLYYELRVNGRFADPLRAHLRAGRVLEGDALAAFEKMRARTDRLVEVSAQRAAAE
jgi:murein DD-endopeptidase MepM/ murein hydrolase activator NlpD